MTKILIVDDDTTLTKMLDNMLAGAGFETFVVNSGHEAVEATNRLKPDAIVLDLMMPNMNGWEVCQAIRQFSQVPILILSAVTDSQEVMRSLDEGANDYLVKPVPKGILVAHLKKLVQSTPSP